MEYEYDFDGDGRPDLGREVKKSKGTLKLIDINKDGKADYFAIDFGNDGKIDYSIKINPITQGMKKSFNKVATVLKQDIKIQTNLNKLTTTKLKNYNSKVKNYLTNLKKTAKDFDIGTYDTGIRDTSTIRAREEDYKYKRELIHRGNPITKAIIQTFRFSQSSDDRTGKAGGISKGLDLLSEGSGKFLDKQTQILKTPSGRKIWRIKTIKEEWLEKWLEEYQSREKIEEKRRLGYKYFHWSPMSEKQAKDFINREPTFWKPYLKLKNTIEVKKRDYSELSKKLLKFIKEKQKEGEDTHKKERKSLFQKLFKRPL